MNIRSDIADDTIRPDDLVPLYIRASTAGVIRAKSPSAEHLLAGASASTLPDALAALVSMRIAAGEPVAAYQEMRTESGPLWVLALHLPLPDGPMTLQMPALSPAFEGIPELYAHCGTAGEIADLAREFSSYTTFSVHAMGQEFLLRNQIRGTARNLRARTLHGVNAALDQTMKEKVELMRSFAALQLIPNNMRIVASRLEPAGGPISAIAENYKTSSAAISQRIASFISGPDSLCEQLARRVSRVLLLMGARRLLLEVLDDKRFGPEPDIEVAMTREARWQDECRLLSQTAEKIVQDVRVAMAQAEECAARFGRVSADIRRHMLGLDTIRVLGRVECSRLHEGAGLSATIDQLDAFHSEIRGRLEAIIRHSETVSEAIVEFQRNDDPY